MSVPDKNISSDFYTTPHAMEPVYKNDFEYYWNGGIPETIDEPDHIEIETNTSVIKNPHTII
jgi:hypothetical protein